MCRLQIKISCLSEVRWPGSGKQRQNMELSTTLVATTLTSAIRGSCYHLVRPGKFSYGFPSPCRPHQATNISPIHEYFWSICPNQRLKSSRSSKLISRKLWKSPKRVKSHSWLEILTQRSDPAPPRERNIRGIACLILLRTQNLFANTFFKFHRPCLYTCRSPDDLEKRIII